MRRREHGDGADELTEADLVVLVVVEEAHQAVQPVRGDPGA